MNWIGFVASLRVCFNLRVDREQSTLAWSIDQHFEQPVDQHFGCAVSSVSGLPLDPNGAVWIPMVNGDCLAD
jgi:hypothetical protein